MKIVEIIPNLSMNKECVELHQLLEIPLLGLDAEEWKEQAVQMPPEFDLWMDAQTKSLAASEQMTNLKDVVFPLYKVAKKVVLDAMWIRINQVSSCFRCALQTTH